jgi:hypothetical protein
MTARNFLGALGLLLGATTASATVTYTFVADGVTNSVSQQGTAVFAFSDDATSLSITLTDNVNPTAFIASELDGLLFTLTETPTSLNLLSVTPQSVINCNGVSGGSCPAGTGTDPYGWGSTQNGASFELGAGFTGSGFSYHPYAIVNENYVAPGGNGGLSNNQHNPLLVGPVTFTFSLSGLSFVPEISSVTFLFGTVPDSQQGDCTQANCEPPCTAGAQCDPPPCTNGDCGDQNVPEPRSIALLGLALLSAVWISRRRVISEAFGLSR